MKLSFSKRETLLLLILAMVLFWYAAAQAFILPRTATIDKLQDQVEIKAAEKEQMDIIIESGKNLEADLKAEQDKMAAESYFYRNIDDVFTDRTLQELARKHSLTMTSGAIEEAVETRVEPYYGQIKVLLYPIKESQVGFDALAAETLREQLSHQAPAETESTAANTTVLPMIANTVTVSGRVNNIIAMVNEISNYNRSLYVAGVDLEAGENGNHVGTVTVNFFFLE